MAAATWSPAAESRKKKRSSVLPDWMFRQRGKAFRVSADPDALPIERKTESISQCYIPPVDYDLEDHDDFDQGSVYNDHGKFRQPSGNKKTRGGTGNRRHSYAGFLDGGTNREISNLEHDEFYVNQTPSHAASNEVYSERKYPIQDESEMDFNHKRSFGDERFHKDRSNGSITSGDGVLNFDEEEIYDDYGRKLTCEGGSGYITPPIDYSDHDSEDDLARNVPDSGEVNQAFHGASARQNFVRDRDVQRANGKILLNAEFDASEYEAKNGLIDSSTLTKVSSSEINKFISTPNLSSWAATKESSETFSAEELEDVPKRKTSRVRFSKFRQEIYDSLDSSSESDHESSSDGETSLVPSIHSEEMVKEPHATVEPAATEEPGTNEELGTPTSNSDRQDDKAEDFRSESPLDYFSQPLLFTGLYGKPVLPWTEPERSLGEPSPEGSISSGICSKNGSPVEMNNISPRMSTPRSNNTDVAAWISASVKKANLLKQYRMKKKQPDIFEESSRCGGGMDDGGSSVSSASCGSCGSAGNEEVVLRILVPELSVERCLTFHSQDLVWTVKQAALTSLPKVALWYRELRESFNYGLFCPPQNGRAGKFLDEERPLADYPLSSSPMGYLELKYKRRVYKMLKLEEKTLRALHTRANLRRFLEWVKEGNVEKVAKLCSKGLDPNFHCQETGDTPLTIAARGNLKGRKGCAALLVALVNGGALLDYRTKDGLTAMHRAVQADNLQAVRTLLDLGASPNYRDHRGLTPLYYCVTYAKDPLVCEALLHDYSIIGVADHQGWQETHQACRNKLVQHLEHLLFYGADLNGQNASGNTPLHVCAVNNLEDCARVLLFRGCDKIALNFANQNPHQVAIISGNLELAEIINKHNPDDIVPFKSPPRYNPRRRVSGAPLLRATSDPRLETPCVHKPPSPAPSARSIPPFSSASSLSETSTGSGSTASNASSSHVSEGGDEGNGSYEGRTHSCSTALEALSDSSSGICSSYQSSGDASHPHATLTRSAPHTLLSHTKVQENVEEEDEGEEEEEEESGSDSSSNGVGGSADSAPGGGGGGGGGGAGSITYDVGALVVCVIHQTVMEEGQLALNQGDIVQVTGSTDDGLLEGMVRGVTGTFPPSCVQPVRLRNPQAVRDSLLAPQVNRNYSRSHSVEGSNSPPSVTHYGTAPRVRKPQPPTPRCVVLHRGRKGFGFVLRGAKATSPLMDRGATPRGGIALQYLDDVDPGGVADLAGLKPGDYLLKINGEDVSQASHEHVVTLIRKSADLVEMTVVTPEGDGPVGGSPHKPPYGATPYTTSSLKRGCQTLPRKHNFSRSISQSGPPAPPPRAPSTSLSVGRARARSVVGNLQQHHVDGLDSLPITSSPPKLASIKARPASALRMTASQVEDMITKNSGGSLPPSPSSSSNDSRPPRVYASVAEMKKAKALRSRLPGESRGLHKVFHSTPDLQNGLFSALLRRNTLSQENLSDDPSPPSSPSQTEAPNSRHSVASHSQTTLEAAGVGSSAYSIAGYYATTYDAQNSGVSQGSSLDHRRLRRSQSAISSSQLLREEDSPQAPAVGQVVKVDISRSKSEYASVSQTVVTPTSHDSTPTSPGVMSSFRPSDCAKLYASPEQIKTVGYRNPQLLAQLHRTKSDSNTAVNAKNRSQSLPPTASRQPILKPSPEKDTSMDSGIYSSTHSTFRGAEMENDNSPCDDDLPLPPPPPEEDLITYARPQNNKSVKDQSKLMSTSYTMNKVEPVFVDHRRMSASFTGLSSGDNDVAVPEPDYSSEEDGTYNSQYEASRKVKSIIKRKKQHSVAFAPSVVGKREGTREPPHYAAPIIKDPTTTLASTTATTPPPSTSPPSSSSSSSPPSRVMPGNFTDLIAKKAAERRIRQESSGNSSAPGSATSSPSRRNLQGTASKGLSDAILESALFNKQKEKVTNGNGKLSSAQGATQAEPINMSVQRMKNSKSCPNEFAVEDGDNSSSGVSSDHEIQQDGTYVTVINTESNTISETKGKNSLSKNNSVEESSVSSESSEDASDRTWILTNERSEKTESPKEVSTGIGAVKRSGGLTKNAVSLVKLPPPQEKTELFQTDRNNGPMRETTSHAEMETHSYPYWQLPASHPLASSNPLPYHLQGAIHPSNIHVGQAKFSTLQRPHSNSKRFTKAGSDPPPNHNAREYGGGTLIRSRSTTRDELNLNSGSATLDRNFSQSNKGRNALGPEYEKSMDESLQLIRMHINSLNEVNVLAGIPSSKRFEDHIGSTAGGMSISSNANKSPNEDTRSGGEVLAPPPQFSDPSVHVHDNANLPSGGAMGSTTGSGKRSKTAMMREATNEEDMPICVSRRSNRRVEEEFISGGEDERTFRNKTLDEWSTRDTTDWLESLFMPEYKDSFENKQIDGEKLLKINNESLINLGVRRVGHRVTLEKSLKRYRPIERIDL